MKAIYDIDQSTIVSELATIDQALGHQLPVLILDGDTAIAELIDGTHTDQVRAQGFIQQQADIFQYDHHSLVKNKGCLSMTAGRSKKFDPVWRPSCTVHREHDRLTKRRKAWVSDIMFHKLHAGAQS